MVVALVGPKEKESHLRKDLLLDRSMLLEERLERSFPDGKYRGMHLLFLHDEPVKAFETFIKWLYGATLVSPSWKKVSDYINLHLMADYLGAESLMNTSINLIREADHHNRWEWQLGFLFENYDKIPKESPLRDFLLRITVWTGLQDSNPLIDHPKLLHRKGSLVANLLKTHEVHSKREMANPRREANCTFHRHKHTQKCSGKEEARGWICSPAENIEGSTPIE